MEPLYIILLGRRSKSSQEKATLEQTNWQKWLHELREATNSREMSLSQEFWLFTVFCLIVGIWQSGKPAGTWAFKEAAFCAFVAMAVKLLFDGPASAVNTLLGVGKAFKEVGSIIVFVAECAVLIFQFWSLDWEAEISRYGSHRYDWQWEAYREKMYPGHF